MKQNRRVYSRYHLNRGNVALWKGSSTERGSTFRQVVLTSDAWNSTDAIFQIFALEGTSNGLKNGVLDIDDAQIKVLFDEDRQGLKAAADKAQELVQQAQRDGFKELSIFDQARYEEKVRQSTPHKSPH